tara:strand:- start:26225 stop:27019 length:795 start_codon:yes stop_codon:yes gene_type:complete
MPDPITISQDSAPAQEGQTPEEATLAHLEEAAAKLEEEGNLPSDAAPETNLIGGEFETQEDLLAAYNELKAQGNQSEPEPVGSAQEIYGEAVGNLLEQSNVDYVSMNDYWQEQGEITDAHYKELEQAGFPRSLVDAHLNGLRDQAAVTEKEIFAIRDSYGQDNFANMQDWAKNNLTDAEKKAYSAGISSNNIEQVKLTVAGLHARFVAASGQEPTLLSGRPSSGGVDKYESTAQLEDAMNDPRYARDPAYRAQVQEKLGRSNIF